MRKSVIACALLGLSTMVLASNSANPVNYDTAKAVVVKDASSKGLNDVVVVAQWSEVDKAGTHYKLNTTAVKKDSSTVCNTVLVDELNGKTSVASWADRECVSLSD